MLIAEFVLHMCTRLRNENASRKQLRAIVTPSKNGGNLRYVLISIT